MNEDSRFFRFLKERIGLDAASVGEAIVERAVRQRSTASGSADSEAYWQLLIDSAQEQQALIEAVIVPETWFFRYAESFSTLGKLAAARIQALGNVRPLRILSLPCSTGEEPYSIAMALFDAGLGAGQFKIDAMDISPLSIERAKRGVYGKNSFRGSETGFRDRFFSASDQGYQIAERVRECVVFQPGNLLDPSLLSRTAYDFVFCRNLVIYFDQPTQKHVFEVLKRLTLPDGILFIGPAEGSLLAGIGMRSIGVPHSFAFRHAPAQSPAMTLPAPDVNLTRTRARFEPPRPIPRPMSRAFAPAPSAVRRVFEDSDPAALLASIARFANEGRTAEARAACERYLQQHEAVAQVFYWLGLLSEVEGHASQAQGLYRKALYLQPQHAESLAQLAALLAAQGDLTGARRLQDRAARGAERAGERGGNWQGDPR